MEQTNSITIQEERKRGKHLSREERDMLQMLHRQGCTLRAIAEYVGCANTTVYYELKRGTPAKKNARGRQPVYTAKRGQAAYDEHRKNCRRPLKLDTVVAETFIQELTDAVRDESASIDEFIGRVRLEARYAPSQILSTKSIYNMLHKGKLPFTVFDVPQILNRKKHRNWTRKHKRLRGTSIDQRPKEIAERREMGHWEADTVIGHREGKESCVFTMVEMVSHKYIAIKISGRTTKGVQEAMVQLRRLYGKHFSDVFKSITADNGAEFQDFKKYEERYGTKIYFAHPFSSWERPQNERHNEMLRQYLPKGKSLGYYKPDELFDAFLDKVYSIDMAA